MAFSLVLIKLASEIEQSIIVEFVNYIMETEFFLGLNLYAWITIVTVLGMFTTLLFTKLRVDTVFLAAIGIFLVTGVLDTKEALSGFSSSSVVVIGVLFVVAYAVLSGILCASMPATSCRSPSASGTHPSCPATHRRLSAAIPAAPPSSPPRPASPDTRVSSSTLSPCHSSCCHALPSG